MKNLDRRNKYFFGLGTIGRDMFYAFEANALLYFLSNILSLPLHVFAAVSLVLSVLRIADALNDPITGLVIDNIHTKWGKFKPAILVGGVVSVIFYLILFGNVGTGTAYVIFFAAAYVLWDISYGINDIAYWTLLPALTQDQKQRENYGAFARICANIGMYIIMVGWQPITAALGNTPKAWMTVAVSVSVIYLAGLCFPLFGVKENRTIGGENEEKVTLRDMWHALVRNDQLMWTTLAMGLFMVGYCTTTGFATYYMQYLFGDINLYAVLAAVCGVAQLAALMIFPLFSKHFNRHQLYTGATLLVIVGYAVFFFAEHSIVLIALAGGLIFGVIYGCIRISRGFKTSFVDRRDLVENLPEDERTTVRERAQKRDRPGFLDRSPTAAMRRKYRKTLLHAAKEPPARWMSPAEAEAHAKLQNDALHIVYEKARYSEKGCTKDDLTAI